jgi:hypothetical protein
MAGGAAAATLPGAEFGLRYLSPSGEECEQKLAVGWNVRFGHAPPVRKFHSYRGQRNFSGSWWSATTGELVGFESWLERDQVMMLDFSPDVIGIASQPFWLTWPDAKKLRRHAPDYFARLKDGSGVVIDVRADERIDTEDAEVFAVTAEACALVGWDYRRVGAIDQILSANIRWLAGYRHRRYRNDQHVHSLLQAFAGGAPLLSGIDGLGDPLSVLPALYHLLWSGTLTTDLRGDVLGATSMVTTNGGC